MLIMIDAGHGPNTPGKRSPDGMREFEFNSRVADVMKAELEKYEGVSVVFAHESGRDVPLAERTNKANALKVDVYVSLHADALNGVMGGHGGTTTFVYKTNPANSRKLADVIHRNLLAVNGLRNRTVKTADFHVLRETNMTAVLIEHGFMDSTTDLPKLKDDAFRVLCGKTNAKSVAEHYGLKLKHSPAPTSAPPNVEIIANGEYVGRKLTIKNDGLWFYDTPRWDICSGVGGKGHTFTITEELRVDGTRMVKCADGKYRTADPQYVIIDPPPSDWPYRVIADGITHAQAQEIVNLLQSNYKGANIYGEMK